MRTDIYRKATLRCLSRVCRFPVKALFSSLREDAFRINDVVPTEANAPDLKIFSPDEYIDWQKWYIGNTAKKYNTHLSIGGGNDLITFTINGNYLNEKSVLAGENKYERWGLQSNISFRSPRKRQKIHSTFRSTHLYYDLDF